MKVISLGLGVQSSALYFMSSLGELPRVDFAIFADTGAERMSTYAYLEFMEDWGKCNNGIPIIVCRERNLYEDLINAGNVNAKRFASIPAFTRSASGKSGMLKRQCTNEYKVVQIDRAIRGLHGLKKGQRGLPTDVWIGITLDEADRMSEPKVGWKCHVYPFTDFAIKCGGEYDRLFWSQNRSRIDLYQWYEGHSIRIPEKSGCFFCPFRSDKDWRRMKTESPLEFAKAVAVDGVIRNSTKKGIEQPIYLHRSVSPLGEVQFDNSDLWSGECSGHCHV